MDTKWKKSKGILSVLFLLIGLTLMAIFGGIGLLGASSLELGDVADSFRSDYQDTRASAGRSAMTCVPCWSLC